jgi:hypothetical protein
MGDVVPGATDIDFMCERNGHFLVIELKDFHKGIRMSYGQHLALRRLNKQPCTRVFLLGEEGDGLYLTQYSEDAPPRFTHRGGKKAVFWPPERFESVTREQVREVVQRWWEEVSQGPPGQAAA